MPATTVRCLRGVIIFHTSKFAACAEAVYLMEI